MTKAFAFVLVCAFAAPAVTPDASMRAQVTTVCHQGDAFMTWVLQHQRWNLKFYPASKYWAAAGLTRGDTSRIQPVVDDSLCRIAALTINRDMRLPDTAARQVYMVTQGPFFLALDPALKGGEFHTGYLLDRSLTKVIERLAM